MVIDGEPWFVGKDVAEILGCSDTYGALKKHADDEDKQNCQNDSFESPRGMTVINESGLYSLVIGSKLPSAKKSPGQILIARKPLYLKGFLDSS